MPSAAALEYKDNGNKLFQQQRFTEAVEAYGKAIARNSSDPSFFTNRALCYMNLKKWSQAADDCRRALELDKSNVKANYFLAKICRHQGQLDESIILLTRAHDLAYNLKLAFGDEITAMLRQTRRDKFKIEEEKRLTQEIELQSYLNELIEKDVDHRVAQFLESVHGRNDDSVTEEIEEIKMDGVSKKEQLNTLFAQVDDRRRKRDIPDYLCGKISFELLKDPVITPSGITYDRADIKEHLHRVGHFDPITRVPLTVEQLIPNLAMKEVLDAFIAENEWALDA